VEIACAVRRAYLQADRFVFLQTQASTSLKDILLSYAMSDPALLHSVLAHSALHFSTLSSNKSSTDLLYHKAQAISLLNTRIRDPTLQSAISTTFCAVACMIHLEVSSHPRVLAMTADGLYLPDRQRNTGQRQNTCERSCRFGEEHRWHTSSSQLPLYNGTYHLVR
jgi:hypothetical protein